MDSTMPVLGRDKLSLKSALISSEKEQTISLSLYSRPDKFACNLVEKGPLYSPNEVVPKLPPIKSLITQKREQIKKLETMNLTGQQTNFTIQPAFKRQPN